MTATKLRMIFIGVIVSMILGCSLGGFLLQQQLAQTVLETDHARIDAEVAVSELQQLKRLDQQFTEQKDILERAKQIAASADQYKYQDQVINDINEYARRYRLQVSTFDFSTNASSIDKSPVNGTKKTPFTVTLNGPLPYSDFLKFIGDIERNLTKIQVNSLALSPDKNPALVTNPTLNLEVYLKR